MAREQVSGRDGVGPAIDAGLDAVGENLGTGWRVAQILAPESDDSPVLARRLA